MMDDAVIKVLGSFLQGVPTAAIVLVAVALIKKDVKVLGNAVKEIKDDTRTCKSAREEAEQDLHNRVTKTVERIAHLEGVRNGGIR